MSKFIHLSKRNYSFTFDHDELQQKVGEIITEFSRQNVVENKNDVLMINRKRVRTLQLHSSGVRELLQRYYISLSVLLEEPEMSRKTLEKESRSVAQRLSILHGINSPEFFDKAIFTTFSSSLRNEGYFDENGNVDVDKAKETELLLRGLISSEIQLSVEGAVAKLVESKEQRQQEIKEELEEEKQHDTVKEKEEEMAKTE